MTFQTPERLFEVQSAHRRVLALQVEAQELEVEVFEGDIRARPVDEFVADLHVQRVSDSGPTR